MFKKLFGGKKKKSSKNPSSQSKPSERNLFEELFPLSAQNKQVITEKAHTILHQMIGEEGFQTLKNYKRNYSTHTIQYKSLEFTVPIWDKIEETDNSAVYQSEHGDILQLNQARPNGLMTRDSADNSDVYRQWIRNLFVQQNGGLIFCKRFQLANGLDGFESITKAGRPEGQTGIDYVYLLNISNYDEQLLYQVMFKFFEMSPTGLRDNTFMQPIAEIAKMDFASLFNHFRQDPYDKNFKGGNVMNLSEKQEFDDIYPFHPLSIIRNEIQPIVKPSLRFIS